MGNTGETVMGRFDEVVLLAKPARLRDMRDELVGSSLMCLRWFVCFI